MSIRRNTLRRATGTTSPPRASSQPDDSGTFTVASWNICNGRNGGLESTVRAMGSLGVDFAFLQETKLTDGIYSRNTGRYSVLATRACSRSQGGVALVWKESEQYIVEEQRSYGANVITCQLVTGKGRYYIVRCYLPPHDTTAADEMEKAIKECPRGCLPLLMGDLNINLLDPRDARDEKVTEILDAQDFFDASKCF